MRLCAIKEWVQEGYVCPPARALAYLYPMGVKKMAFNYEYSGVEFNLPNYQKYTISLRYWELLCCE
jgi:hypothetical protein